MVRRPSPRPATSIEILSLSTLGGAVVGLAWSIYVFFGLIDWYPVIFNTGRGPTASPLLAMPFLAAVGFGAALAMRPIAGFRLRVVRMAFVAHGAAAVIAYGLMSATWFETQTPAHVVFFGLGAVATIAASLTTSLLRLAVTAVAVGAFALVIDRLWILGQNPDPDLYLAMVIAIAVAYWLLLVWSGADRASN